MLSIELMGVLFYLVGLITLIIGVAATLVPIGIGGFERIVIYGAGVLVCSLGYGMATPGSGGSRVLKEEQNSIAKMMGWAIFAVGAFSLLVALADLLHLGNLQFGFGERVLVYGGGIILCVLGYFMARRIPFIPVPPAPPDAEAPAADTLEGPPPERY